MVENKESSMKDVADLLKTVFEHFEKLLRYAFPGVVYWVLSGWFLPPNHPLAISAFSAQISGPLVLLTLVKIAALGVIIYSVHRYGVLQIVEYIAFLRGHSALAEIRANRKGIGFTKTLGIFLKWRFGKDFDAELSKHLLNRWAFSHLMCTTSELGLAFFLFSLCPQFKGYREAAIPVLIVSLILLAFGFIQAWSLYGAEAEIYGKRGEVG